MESQSFLQEFKAVFQKLQSEGIVTPEEIERGVDIPLICFNVKQKKGHKILNRKTIEYDLREIHTKGYYPLRQFDLGYFLKHSKLRYSEKNGVPYLESIFEYSFESGHKPSRKSSKIISDQNIDLTNEHSGKYGWISSEHFISTVLKAKIHLHRMELEKYWGQLISEVSNREIKKGVDNTLKQIYSPDRLKQEIEQTIPRELSACADEVLEYYRIKDASAKGKPIEAMGNVPEADNGGTLHRAMGFHQDRGGATARTYHYEERINAEIPFSERDRMYREYGCSDVIQYVDEQDDNSILHSLYLYENPHGQNGTLCIDEPFQGNMSTRVFFIPQGELKVPKDPDEAKKYWRLTGKKYIEMSQSEFLKTKNTVVILHDGDIDKFSRKMGGVLGKCELETPYDRRRLLNLGLLPPIDSKKMLPNGLTSARLKKTTKELEKILEVPESEAIISKN